MNNPLTHFNEEGRARMVDVSEKAHTSRKAVANGEVFMLPETLRLIKEGQIKKGDVLRCIHRCHTPIPHLLLTYVLGIAFTTRRDLDSASRRLCMFGRKSSHDADFG